MALNDEYWFHWKSTDDFDTLCHFKMDAVVMTLVNILTSIYGLLYLRKSNECLCILQIFFI